MNVDTMPSGPELDVLVAEKVMGWTDVHLSATAHRLYVGLRPGSTQKESIPEFSAQIPAAWEVVERLRAEGRAFMLHDNSFNGEWQACFEIRKDLDVTPRPFVAFLRKTPAEAICRAALKAMEGR